MVDLVSPLGDTWQPGTHGNASNGPGVILSETQPGSIVEIAAWPGTASALLAAVASSTGLALSDGPNGGAVAQGICGFGIGPGKFLIAGEAEGLANVLAAAIPIHVGAVTDLSHGRTCIRIEGPKAEWVLAKFFALDFSLPAFPVGSGKASAHHDIFAAIQRTGDERFDLYVFRSFARSFWKALCHGAQDVGYSVE